MEMTHKERFAKLVGAEKYVIACTHLLALPGAPAYDREGGVKKIMQQALRDTRILIDNGITALLFVNEADLPYKEHLPGVGVATFSAVVQEVVSKLDIKIAYGINCIADPTTGFSVALATGATFLRGNFFGVSATNTGIYTAQGVDLYRTKSNLGLKQTDPPYFFHNLGSDHGHDMTERDPLGQVKSLRNEIHAQPHGWVISAQDLDAVQAVQKAAPEFPIVVAKSTNPDNLLPWLEVFDGTIVASTLHEGGKLFAPVDAKRTKKFMDVFHSKYG